SPGARPLPFGPSAQFHVTVMSVVFQPAALGAGDCVGLATGGVLSSLTVWDALPRLPALSLQVAVRVCTPSPLEVLLVVQLAASTPAAASVQFQVTVTSLVFQPAALAWGDRLGLAAGGVVSGV